MSFQIKEYKGYENGKRYKKILTFVKSFGNANNRYVQFKDSEGVILDWKTNDRVKTYKNLKFSAEYSFTVDFIFNDERKKEKSISIKNLREVSSNI